MSFSVAMVWTPDFQDLDLDYGRAYQDATGTLELDIFYFWISGLLSLFSKQSQRLSKHCQQHCYCEFEDLSFCQTLGANSVNTPSKVNHVLCLLIAECSPGPSNYLPCAVPSAYRSGTWIFAHGNSYHFTTEEDTIPVDHCDPRGIKPSWCGLHLYSCPFLHRMSTTLYSEVKGPVCSKSVHFVSSVKAFRD